VTELSLLIFNFFNFGKKIRTKKEEDPIFFCVWAALRCVWPFARHILVGQLGSQAKKKQSIKDPFANLPSSPSHNILALVQLVFEVR